MENSTRRGFLATAAVGAVGVGVAAAAPGAHAAGTHHRTVPSDAAGPLVVHVADVHGDTATVMVGEREVVVHDRDLVIRLARAAF